MKLSIITINYNNRDGLRKTIDSVLSQTFTDYEYIIIDGGSTDGSREVIESVKDRLAYWCSEPDKGIYNAMNKGIAKAKGDYLNFLNSGDVFHDSNVLGFVFECGRNVDIIYGNLNFVSTNTSNVFFYPPILSLHYLLYRSLGHPATFIRISLLKEHGYREDFKIVSDWFAFLKWYREGKSFEYVDLIIADFDTYGISSIDHGRLNEEKISVYNELIGHENIQWIEESITMQQMYERYDNSDLKAVSRIKRYGGKRWILLHYLIVFLNRTIINGN